jgi:Flp pilus assembly protein TadG
MRVKACRFIGLSKAHGQATIELVMSFLMFVIMVAALLGVSTYLYVNHSLLTAAKEGARAASLDVNLGNTTTRATGVTAVQNRVITFVRQSTGFTIPANNITVTGPTGTTGSRIVQVQVQVQFTNPVQIRTFLNRLNGGNTSNLDRVTIRTNASMRYEE